jgi:hypothetical protein
MLLQGYINTLKAYSVKSYERGDAGDVSTVTLQPLLVSTSPTGQFGAFFVRSSSDTEQEGVCSSLFKTISLK